MKKTGFSILLGALLSALSAVTAHAHHGNFQICNISANNYGVALASRTGIGILSNRWRFSGFYTLPAGECAEPFGAAISDAIQSYIAIRKQVSGGYVEFKNDFSSNNRFAEESDRKMCVKLDKGFSYQLPLEAAGGCTGDELHPFHIYINVPSIPIGQGRTNILFLK